MSTSSKLFHAEWALELVYHLDRIEVDILEAEASV